MQSSAGESLPMPKELGIYILQSTVGLVFGFFSCIYIPQICYHVLGLVHGIWTPIPRAVRIPASCFPFPLGRNSSCVRENY